MSSTDALVLILVFGSIGILLIASVFITAVIWHQRRWMAAVEERTRYREALLEAAFVGRLIPWSCPLDGSGLNIGDSVTTLLKVLPEDLSSLEHLLAFVPRHQRETLKDLLSNSEPDQEIVFRTTMTDPTGKNLATLWQFRRRGEALKGIIRDISREEHLQQQLLQAQKLESLGTMVGGVAHEFGNLLAAVESCAQALQRRENLDPKARQGIALILDAAMRGRGIISQLLNFSRRDPEQRQRVNLFRMSEDVADMMRPLLGRSYKLSLELATETPMVLADPIRLHQALLNLCINARDAMPQGGPLTIRIQNARMDPAEAILRQKQPGTYVCVEVEDTGTGIEPEHLDRICEPFFTTKAPGRGTGLGLAVTHSIAEAHGGFLHCESQVGQGSKFCLCLPAAPS